MNKHRGWLFAGPLPLPALGTYLLYLVDKLAHGYDNPRNVYRQDIYVLSEFRED